MPEGPPQTPELSPQALDQLASMVSTYAARRAHWDDEGAPVRIVDAVRLRAGRPGLLDVVAEMGGRLVHVPIALRDLGESVAGLSDGEDPILGTFDDEGAASAVAFDALADGEAAALLLAHVTGWRTDPALVRQLHQDSTSVTLAMDDRYAFTVFNEMTPEARPDVDVPFALDEAGFNHLPAPLYRWRRGAWDLGMVQEHLSGASVGLALALTSVRDLYASGGPPEMAGGDFGAEAHRMGTTAARMHLALDSAYGRRPGDISRWADAIEVALRERSPLRFDRPELSLVLAELRALPSAGEAIRTHGDFHLGRVWRTEQGWYVGDFAPAGIPPLPPGGGPPAPVSVDDGIPRRSPLADVADMFWSFGHVAASAAAERDPTGSEGLDELASAWEERNRRAFLTGYLGVPAISALVPTSRETVRILVAAFEAERASRVTAGSPAPAGS